MSTTPKEWEANSELAQDLVHQFERAIASYEANPNLISEHANHEESIRVGGYSNRTLLELVQNAADAMSGDGSIGDFAGRVEIVLDPENGTLYCANSGRPFSRQGLTSISHAHLSAKRGDEIGRFGLGFKSVLAVTDAPRVYSRSVSFEFNSSASRSAIEAIGSDAKRFPVLRTATLIDAGVDFAEDPILAQLAQWAATVVKLPNANHLDRLREEIESFSSEFLLFASTVREVKLRVLGTDGFETGHSSRDLGAGSFKIERPDGTGDEWLVLDEMHRPSPQARKEVGEAVSRDEVKVTVALPMRNSQLRLGQFWSYFPLQDLTSASALFNAPWSVNDDRTTLLRNHYNREILRTLATMFVKLLPRVSSSDDPGAHLDYLPARGREERSFGDGVLCALVPALAKNEPLIPDATGTFRLAAALKPLDFAIEADETTHHAWIMSPNTGDDVPHWRCYTSSQRTMRIRQLFAVSASPDFIEDGGRDMKRALERIVKRGVLSWLTEWADGDDSQSAANAFRFVIGHPGIADIARARVIPTSQGLRSMSERNMVFLEREDDVEIEGAVFVDPGFLAERGIEKLLRDARFRRLDPVAILNARVADLTGAAGESELSKFWEAALGVTTREALDVIRSHPHAVIKVPTRDGGWGWPRQVVDLDDPLSGEFSTLMLDRQRCTSPIAHELGVIRKPIERFDIEDEPSFDEYRSWVLATLNDELGPGDRRIEKIELYPTMERSPGPFSMLLTLRDAGAASSVREEWTRELLKHGDAPWDCEDQLQGNHRVISPVRWAVERAGVVNSSEGYVKPDEVVASSLAKYKGLLPLYVGPKPIGDALNLPSRIEDVPASVLAGAFKRESFPAELTDQAVTAFLLVATPIAFPNSRPPRVPARVGRHLESISPSSVYIAITDEQRAILMSRQRPFLLASEEEAGALVSSVGCQRFEDSFAVSFVVEGQQVGERVLDVFTGLRMETVSDVVASATIVRASTIAKLVSTEDGVESQALEFHLDGVTLTVQSEIGEQRLLEVVNEAFDLRLSNADLRNVRKIGLDHRLELLRQSALAATTDAERLETYIGDDDLREALPSGLWQALEAQGLVDPSTSVAELYLTVNGSDSIKQLAELFRREGFPDVPTTWAGGNATISWLRQMGFEAKYAGRRIEHREAEFVVPGAVKLAPLHDFQEVIRTKLGAVLTTREPNGRALKAMVELPTGAGKTRIATETVLRLFITGQLSGHVIWIAQSQELCEQAVQTWSEVWRGLGDERPLTIGRLWESNDVHQPDTEFSVVVATDAKLDIVRTHSEYDWVKDACAVIVDEGHRAGDSERYTRILTWLGVAGRGWARPLVGLSATPFKGTSPEGTRRLAIRFGDRILSAFEANAYRELAKIGVLARVRHEVLTGVDVDLKPEERQEAMSMKRVNQNVLDRIGRDQVRMSILVDHIMKLDPDWPVLVFTPSILSAQVLAATLRYRGVAAASVSGQTGRQERRDVIESFKRNEIRVLTNCDLLVQGFDAPGVRALYIARPTFSPNPYIQMAGRGLRGPENGGKDECLIVDMADNFGYGDINDLLGFRGYEDLWTEQHG